VTRCHKLTYIECAASNAEVAYSTNLVGQVNTLTLSFDIVTAIPPQGGLIIQGPPGFTFPDLCRARANDLSTRVMPHSLQDFLKSEKTSGVSPSAGS